MSVFDDIYEEQSKKIYAFLMSLTGDSNETEEILQETFYQVFLHINQFEGRSSLYTWICQIAKNAWYKECRRKKKINYSSDISNESLENAPSPEDIYIKKEKYTKLRNAILNLNEPYRDVLILHIYGDIKLKEIALYYEKSESWAKVTFLRAKSMIMEELKNEGYL